MAQTTRESVSGDVLLILNSLRENPKSGRSNKLADVKSALELSVRLEFDRYFFFLRKFNYIAMDRDAQLRITDNGDKVLGGERASFEEDVMEYFADELDANPLTDVNLADELTSAAFYPPVVLPSVPSISPITEEPKGTDLDQRYFRFDAALGEGPLGHVFPGKQHALGVEVAIKELKDIFGYFAFLKREDVLKRLAKEVCAQARVQHPCVVAVFDQKLEGQKPYWVTERMSSSLADELEQAKSGLAPAFAVRAFLQICYGLQAAHAVGLNHHNLKPENVLFDRCGNAKLSDFGLARVIEVDANKGLPQVFVGSGGLNYLAPELVARDKDSGPSADVYGVGILLYQMLVGQLPGRRSPLPSEVNPQVPIALDSIFDKMTQDRRERRYASVSEVLTDFYAAFSGEYSSRGDLLLNAETRSAA